MSSARRPPHRPEITDFKTRSCIVIGAGLAGLAAARYLCKAGWMVTVLEARRRFGGRVLSYRFRQAPNLVCELGAEWIGRDHDAVQQLCRELHLPLEAHSYGFGFWTGGAKARTQWFRPGAWPFKSVSERQFKAFGKKLHHYSLHQKRLLDQVDWWTQLQHIGFSEADLLRRDLMDSTDFGESIRMTSGYAAATEYFDGNATDEMDIKVQGGNDRLIGALVADIRSHGGHLFTGSVVRAAHQRRGRVQVTTAQRQTPYEADYAICTVPARSLERIDWNPSLPQDQLRASNQLQYARIIKTAVLYNRRFWKTHRHYGFSAFTGRVSDFCFDSTFPQPGKMGILCSYAIGDKADDVAGEPNAKAVMRWLTEDMIDIARPPRPGSVRPLDIVTCPWQQDPLTGGAYALYRPGQWFTVRPILQRPHHRVLFAGEHLADWQGFMEGAVDTGLTAARSL